MAKRPMAAAKEGRRGVPFMTSALIILSILAVLVLGGCDSSEPASDGTDDRPLPSQVDYRPLPRDDWQVSTPAEQGMDPDLVAELYREATELETLYGLLVVKNGVLVAEEYLQRWIDCAEGSCCNPCPRVMSRPWSALRWIRAACRV